MPVKYVPTPPEHGGTADIDPAIHAYLGERASQAVLVLGTPGAGHLEFVRRMEGLARSQSRRTATIRISPGQPPMMFALALAETLEVDDADPHDSVEFTRRIRAALREVEGPPCSLVLFLHGLEELPAEDAAVVENLLGTPPRSSGVLLVGLASTRRADGSRWSGLTALRERVSAQQRCEVLDLYPVQPPEARQFADAILGPGAASQRLVDDLTAHAGAQRDDLHDLLAMMHALEDTDRLDLLAESRSIQSAPVPPSVADRAQRVLEPLSPDARAVASALGVWDHPAWGRAASEEAVARLVDDGVDVEMGLTQLLEREVVEARPTGPQRRIGGAALDQFVISPPLLARAFYLQTPPLLRRRLHRLSAALLEERLPDLTDDETVSLAEHLLEGGRPLTTGYDLFERSARILTSRSRFVDAREQLAGLQDRLAREGEGEGERQRHGQREDASEHSALPPTLSALYAEALTRTGHSARAHRLLSGLATGTPGYPQIARRRARDLTALGRHLDAWSVYEQLVASATDAATAPDPQVTQARVEAARVLQFLGRDPEALEQLEHALREALQAADYRTASRAVLARYTIERNAAHPEEALAEARLALRLARRSGDASTVARSTSAVGNAICDFSLPRGMRWFRRAIRLATSKGDYSVLSWAGARYALGEIELGNLDEAERAARRVMHIDAGLHRNRTLPRSHSVVRIIRALRGQPGKDAETTRFWNGADRMDMLNALSMEALAAHAEEMAQGNFAEAHRAVTTVIDWFRETPGRERLLLCDLLPRQAEAALRMEDEAALAVTVGHFEQVRAGTPDFPVSAGGYRQSLGQQALLRGDLEQAVAHLDAAARCFAGAGYRSRATQCKQQMAEAYLRQGQTERALPLLGEAYTFQRRAGTDLQQMRALYRLAGRRAPRERGEGDLTEREMQVARLAAQGLTDAEIALTLDIRRRTVSTHMQNVRTKLSLRSRRELALLPAFSPQHAEAAPPV
ncbi:MAG: LuxR C-terminal-related transcriptional regulator [Dehalococcoidia bacterium]|nr:LuxR C-terminal-related transcriptional regulator [Dehalococcoidia bacterium]